MKYFDKMMVFERPVVIHVDEDIVYGIAYNEKEIEKIAKGTFQTKENILQEYIEYVVGVGCFLSLPDHEENISDDGKWWYLNGRMCSFKSTNVEDFCHRAYAENPLRYLVVDLPSYKKEQLDCNAVISKELWEKVKKNNNLFVPMRTYRHWNWQKQRKRKQRKQRRQRK